MREHDREQILVLFEVEPIEDYLSRGALAVARLAGGVGARVRHGRRTAETGARARHERKVEHEDCEIVVLSEEPLDDDGERTVRFGLLLLVRGLSLSQRVDGGSAGLSRRLEASPLGPRERELATLVVAGASTKEIAARMSLTEATVRTYVKRILAKVGVRSRLQLAAWLQDR